MNLINVSHGDAGLNEVQRSQVVDFCSEFETRDRFRGSVIAHAKGDTRLEPIDKRFRGVIDRLEGGDSPAWEYGDIWVSNYSKGYEFSYPHDHGYGWWTATYFPFVPKGVVPAMLFIDTNKWQGGDDVIPITIGSDSMVVYPPCHYHWVTYIGDTLVPENPLYSISFASMFSPVNNG